MRTILRFLMWTVIVVGVLLAVLRAVAIRWFRLPQNDPVFEVSVLPTLAGGDLVVAARITRPTFGDLVVCPEPDFPERYVIGRIAGEPGDVVRIVNGRPYVNGKKFSVERACDPREFTYLDPNNGSEVTQRCSWEALANHLHKVGGLNGFQVTPEEIQFDVQEGMFFLLSDNRLYPYDSRDFGLVPIDSCKETIVARLVSKDGWMDSEERLDYIQ